MKWFRKKQKQIEIVEKRVKIDKCDDCSNDLLSELRIKQLEHRELKDKLKAYENMFPSILQKFYKLLITMESNGLHIEPKYSSRYAGRNGVFAQNSTQFGEKYFQLYLRGLTKDDLSGISDELINFIDHIELEAKLTQDISKVNDEILEIKNKLNIL